MHGANKTMWVCFVLPPTGGCLSQQKPFKHQTLSKNIVRVLSDFLRFVFPVLFWMCFWSGGFATTDHWQFAAFAGALAILWALATQSPKIVIGFGWTLTCQKKWSECVCVCASVCVCELNNIGTHFLKLKCKCEKNEAAPADQSPRTPLFIVSHKIRLSSIVILC